MHAEEFVYRGTDTTDVIDRVDSDIYFCPCCLHNLMSNESLCRKDRLLKSCY